MEVELKIGGKKKSCLGERRLGEEKEIGKTYIPPPRALTMEAEECFHIEFLSVES